MKFIWVNGRTPCCRNLPVQSAVDQSEQPICDISRQGSCFGSRLLCLSKV